jgi:hypothetical protein
MVDDTPMEMAHDDALEAKRELDEANALTSMAAGFNATAEVLDSLGFDEAAKAASAAASSTSAAAATDYRQGLDLALAASQWKMVADDLAEQAKAQGGAYAADARADKIEDELQKDSMSQSERTTAQVQAARERATEDVLGRRAAEMGVEAKSDADLAQGLEEAARSLDK